MRKKKLREDWKGQTLMEHAPKRATVESEAALLARVKQALESAGALVYRNNTGAIRKGQRWIRFGLCKGSSDLVCVVPGGRALFIETKRAKFGLITEEQKAFIETVRARGAVAGVVTSVEEALSLFEEARKAA